MDIEFRRITDFPRGTLTELLRDAYSFDPRCEAVWLDSWREFDNFFCDRPAVAESCGFLTVLRGRAIGLFTWDPRGLPERVVIGHNGLRAACKGRGYGSAQMAEAMARILRLQPRRIAVTTNAAFLPARRMYERAGLMLRAVRPNPGPAFFAGDEMDYEWRAGEFNPAFQKSGLTDGRADDILQPIKETFDAEVTS